MDAGEVVPLAVFVLVMALGAATVRLVPLGSAAVVERLGRYHRTVGAGINFVIPLVERVRAKVTILEQIAAPPPMPCVAVDGQQVVVWARLYYRVAEPARVVYELADYPKAVEQLTLHHARTLFGETTVDQAQADVDRFAHQLRTAIGEGSRQWGIAVAFVEIMAIEPA